MKDITGAELAVGDLIAWGAGGRRTAGLAIGRITEISGSRGHCQSIMSGRLGREFWERGRENPRANVVLIQRQDWEGSR